ncbi:MAG: hypothetical protein ACQZ2J_23500 [Pseudomonas piscis]|uniref:hypothetical protein n=1 Tax=Pseudomonas piscis TaxID=2614538 RepID=UPI003D29EE90
MALVSIGQVENLEDLVRDLQAIHESLESSCRAQVALAEHKHEEAQHAARLSEDLLDNAMQQELITGQGVEDAQQAVEIAHASLDAAESSLSNCVAQPVCEDGSAPDCSWEHDYADRARAEVDQTCNALEQARAGLELTMEHRMAMERRLDMTRQAVTMAAQALAQALHECNARLLSVGQTIDVGTARLTAAQQALEAYLATHPAAADFHAWLNWDPVKQGGIVTPDVLRDRMNLSAEHRQMLQEYLYERNPEYRAKVDRFRAQWVGAKGDVERNGVVRKVRIELCGEFGEQLARHALAPLGGRIEAQGRTLVGDHGRYTKTDLMITGLRVPVVLGRGPGMGAQVGGSLALEVKCGRAQYLYAQKDHMVFQAEGHKQADAQCTLCSRDIKDLSPEKEKELRDTLREAGSPLIGMLPTKNEIDQSCLDFIRQSQEQQP